MDVKHRQRAVSEFLTKKVHTVISNIHGRFKNVCGDALLGERNAQRWLNMFETGETFIDDKFVVEGQRLQKLMTTASELMAGFDQIGE